MNTVWLVAQREMTSKMRSRAYIVTCIIMFVLTLAGPIVLKAVTDSQDHSMRIVATSADEALVQATATQLRAIGTDVTVTTAADVAAKQSVTDGNADAFVQVNGTAITIFANGEPDSQLVGILTQANQQRVLNDQITQLGGDPASVASSLANAVVTTQDIGNDRRIQDPGQYIVGIATGIFIFVAIMTTGSMVATGVVEEKSSRVVEIILSTIKPTTLLAGKLLGLCIVGTVQIVTVAVGVYIGITVSGTELSFSLGTSIVWLIVYYLIGYSIFSIMLGAAASLVSRLEDVGSVMMPFNMLMMLPYIYAISVLPQGDALVGKIGSMIPVFSPFLMPVRIGMGYAETWEIAVSIVLALVFVPVVLWFGARVYRNSVLRSGARVKWRDALKAA
ncbi:ABC transporter permease [Micrococcales bacterium 31B]|nr:ABC transporter permease [Micrococcales bacterium 31B]